MVPPQGDAAIALPGLGRLGRLRHADPSADQLHLPMTDTPAIELRMRAYPTVEVGGRAAPLALRRGLALLVILCETGRKLGRGRLCDLLWPDAVADVARARLRRLVHETNQALRVDVVVGDGDALWLDAAAAVNSDVERARRVARRAVTSPGDSQSRDALEVLLEADAHLLLEGFDFGSDAFDSWVSQRRSEHHRLVARALQRIGEHLVEAGQPLLAGEAAARLVAIEPLADAGHALLLRAHAHRRDLAALESAYLGFAGLLRSELGVRPSPAFESLYLAARQDVLQAPSAEPVDASTTSFASQAAVGLPAIRFAETDDGAVAYLELGKGPTTMIVLFGIWSHIEVAWEQPRIRDILMRLARYRKVVLMDRRGVGLSERLTPEQSVPSGVQDIDAVRRAVGASQVWVFGNSVGGMIAIEYAAVYPESVAGLVLYGASARGAWAPDYPWAPTLSQLSAWTERLRADWGGATSLEQFEPSSASDIGARDWWARLLRQAMSRNSLPSLLREFGRMDVRSRLPLVRHPTLVLQRDGDRITRTGAAQYLAEHIAGARLRLLPGRDHNLWAGDTDAVIDEIEHFVNGASGRMGKPA
jgi:pimeloyl-ACP methyl ester carboxylesterase/DNA-binding SARP family transcriptional activator